MRLTQLNQHLSEHCRKKAALCLRRVHSKLPPEATITPPAEWCGRFASLLQATLSPGAQLAVMGLLVAVLERSTDGYEGLQPVLVREFAAMNSGQGVRKEYLYYGIACPWLQCKCASRLVLRSCMRLRRSVLQHEQCGDLLQVIAGSCRSERR